MNPLKVFTQIDPITGPAVAIVDSIEKRGVAVTALAIGIIALLIGVSAWWMHHSHNKKCDEMEAARKKDREADNEKHEFGRKALHEEMKLLRASDAEIGAGVREIKAYLRGRKEALDDVRSVLNEDK